MSLGRLWLGASIAVAGCAVDAGGLPGRDGSDLGGEVRDLGAFDLGQRDLGRRDAGPLDAGRTDSGPPDLGSPDGGPPDAGGPGFCGPTTGLVGCYPFEGPLPFADRSGLGNDLVASGVTTGAGAVGQAAYLTAGSSLYANDSASLDPSAGFSADLWVYFDVIPSVGRMGIMDKNGQFGMFMYPGGRLTCTGGGGSTEVTGMPAATWMHVACTHDGGTIHLYVDGTERASGSSPGPPPAGTAPLNLGEDSPGGGDQLGGRLDDLRLWTRTLPASAIATAAARR